MERVSIALISAMAALLLLAQVAQAADPLHSWRDGAARQRIILGLFLHHTDADREFAYDHKSHVGTLDKALDQAASRGWVVVDMKKDWKSVFPGSM